MRSSEEASARETMKATTTLNRMWSSRYLKERAMEWTKPHFEEICLNCEINCYANGEL